MLWLAECKALPEQGRLHEVVAEFGFTRDAFLGKSFEEFLLDK